MMCLYREHKPNYKEQDIAGYSVSYDGVFVITTNGTREQIIDGLFFWRLRWIAIKPYYSICKILNRLTDKCYNVTNSKG
jgi:hypothetical protein